MWYFVVVVLSPSQFLVAVPTDKLLLSYWHVINVWQTSFYPYAGGGFFAITK